MDWFGCGRFVVSSDVARVGTINMPNLVQVQVMRKVVLFMAALLILLVMIFSHADAENMTRYTVEHLGWTLIAICILGRTWCGLYIGGQKNKSIVRLGPYSVVRNPLYVFSIMGAIGIGLCSGSVISGLFLGLLVSAVFHIVIQYEEQHLTSRLGPDYRRYVAEVPRWLPNFKRWQDAKVFEVSPHLVTKIFFDALIFALAIPFFEVLERLQDNGLVPILLRMP
jgi:protein-S-isoprenylcysteine O-methyltransferase Ste14